MPHDPDLTSPHLASRRYDEGRITPDDFVRWPKRAELSGFLYHAASQRRNYMLWNHVAQYLCVCMASKPALLRPTACPP